MIRPKTVGGMKLRTWWRGPFRVMRRVGESSYAVRRAPSEELEVHADQLKLCIWEELDEPVQELQFPAPQVSG